MHADFANMHKCICSELLQAIVWPFGIPGFQEILKLKPFCSAGTVNPGGEVVLGTVFIFPAVCKDIQCKNYWENYAVHRRKYCSAFWSRSC